MTKFLFLLTLILSTNVFATPELYTPKPYIFPEGSFQFYSFLDYFKSRSRKDANGDPVPYIDDEAYSKTEWELGGRYSFLSHVEASASLRVRQNNSTEFLSPLGQTETVKESGLESISLALKYALPKKGNILSAFDIKFRLPLYSNPSFNPATAQDFIVLGDAESEFAVGGHLAIAQKNIFGTSLYLNLPTKGLSKELLYDFYAVFPQKKIVLGAGLEGILSLKDDSFSDNPLSKPRIGEGATNLFNSVNRSYVAPYLTSSFLLNNKWRLDGKITYHTMGNSTDEGLGVRLGFTYTFNKKQSEEKKTIGKFKEYSIEGKVLNISEQGLFARINVGLRDEVVQGMRVDFFEFDYAGGNKLIASGKVVRLKGQTADVQIEKNFANRKVKIGHMARILQ